MFKISAPWLRFSLGSPQKGQPGPASVLLLPSSALEGTPDTHGLILRALIFFLSSLYLYPGLLPRAVLEWPLLSEKRALLFQDHTKETRKISASLWLGTLPFQVWIRRPLCPVLHLRGSSTMCWEKVTHVLSQLLIHLNFPTQTSSRKFLLSCKTNCTVAGEHLRILSFSACPRAMPPC